MFPFSSKQVVVQHSSPPHPELQCVVQLPHAIKVSAASTINKNINFFMAASYGVFSLRDPKAFIMHNSYIPFDSFAPFDGDSVPT